MGDGEVGQVSPDGRWYWNGTSWVSAVSPDGKSRWDGTTWVAVRPRRSASYTSPWVIAGGIGAVAAAIVIAAVVVAAIVSPSPQRTAQVASPPPSQIGTSPPAVI